MLAICNTDLILTPGKAVKMGRMPPYLGYEVDLAKAETVPVGGVQRSTTVACREYGGECRQSAAGGVQEGVYREGRQEGRVSCLPCLLCLPVMPGALADTIRTRLCPQCSAPAHPAGVPSCMSETSLRHGLICSWQARTLSGEALKAASVTK